MSSGQKAKNAGEWGLEQWHDYIMHSNRKETYLDDWREAKLFELPEVYLLPVLNPLDPALEELDLPRWLRLLSFQNT